MVCRFCVLGDRDRRAGAGGGHEYRRGQPVHAQRLEILCQSRHQPCRRGGGGQNRLAGGEGRRARLHPVPADAICARSAAARRPLDPADVSSAGVRPVHALVPRRRPAARLGGRHRLGIVDGVEQRTEAACDPRSRRRQLRVLCRARCAGPEHRGCRGRHRHRRADLAEPDWRYCSILILLALATSLQRARSAARIFVNSSDELPMASIPSGLRRAITSGSFAIRINSLSSLVTIVGGVAFGTKMPLHSTASTSAPASFRVGTSGRSSIRLGAATASARTVPALTWLTTGPASAMVVVTWPEITASTDSLALL